MRQLPPSTTSSAARREALRTILTAPLIALIGLSMLSGVLFIALSQVVRERDTVATDQSLRRAIKRHTASVPVRLVTAASLPGTAVVVTAIGLALCVGLILGHHWPDALFVAGAVGGYIILAVVAKNGLQQGRPVSLFRVPDAEYRFPSGHALGATCLAAALGYFLWHGRRRGAAKAFGTVALVGVVALVGGSRLALGVHTPTDVLGGVLLGTAWMAALIAARIGLGRWHGNRNDGRWTRKEEIA